jgi:uncharacterized LabA/DUF88 family protein
MTSRANKLALLIDGPNLRAAAKPLGFDIDYKRLLVRTRQVVPGEMKCSPKLGQRALEFSGF